MLTNRSRTEGFISFRILLWLIPIAALWGGGQGLYTFLSNRTPTVMTLAEFEAQKPSQTWLELRDAQLDIVDATMSELGGTISKVYIPLRVPGALDSKPARVLLLTHDVEIRQLLDQLQSMPDEDATLKFAAENLLRLRPIRTVSGLVQFGIESDDKTRRKLTKINDALADDYVILEHEKKPDWLISGFMLAVGLVTGKFIWFGRRKPEVPQAEPPPLPPKP